MNDHTEFDKIPETEDISGKDHTPELHSTAEPENVITDPESLQPANEDAFILDEQEEAFDEEDPTEEAFDEEDPMEEALDEEDLMEEALDEEDPMGEAFDEEDPTEEAFDEKDPLEDSDDEDAAEEDELPDEEEFFDEEEPLDEEVPQEEENPAAAESSNGFSSAGAAVPAAAVPAASVGAASAAETSDAAASAPKTAATAAPAVKTSAVTSAAAEISAAKTPAPEKDMSFAAETAQTQETEPKKKRKLTILWIILAIIAALCVIYAFLCKKGETLDIDTQYSVNNVNITGMSKEEATAAIEKQFESDYADAAYQVEIEGDSFNVPVFSYLAIDASSGIDKAISYDRGPWISRGLKYIQSKISSVEYVDYEIQPYLDNKEDLLTAVTKVSDAVYVAPEDASWTEEKNLVLITAGTTGRSIDPEKVYNEIVEGIEKGNYSGSVTAEYSLANYKDVDPEEIADAVYKAPKDASYSLENNEIKITKEKKGRKVSVDEIKEALASAQEGTTVTIEEKKIKPKETAKHLEEILLADKLSGYAVVDGGSWTQINNQSIAAAAIDGTIIMPGEMFSFNELVGDTTEEKGYVEDYAYENNKLVTQFGGGVCRVASTLYAAFLYTNLEVIERYNHTSPVHYLPYGMDATVSYPEPDLLIYNNRNYPIQIFISIGDDDYLHAAIYGTWEEGDPYVDVELDFETPMLVHTYRYYYTEEGGELLYTEFMHTSSYVELQPEETPTPTPTPAPEGGGEEGGSQEGGGEEGSSQEGGGEEGSSQEGSGEEGGGQEGGGQEGGEEGGGQEGGGEENSGQEG